jgi:hypothetical protein
VESTAEPGSGFVDIELDGKPLQLKPSLEACIGISNIAGGLNAAVVRCRQLDFDSICQVITLGIGLNQSQRKMVPEAVFRQGLIDLAGPCIEFIHIVANGGKPLPPDGEDQAPDPQNEPSR